MSARPKQADTRGMFADIDVTAVLITILAPTLFWAGYHYYRDRRQPEPLWQTGLAFATGIAAGWLGQRLYQGLAGIGLWFDPYQLVETDLWGLLLYSIFGIALVEELAKLLPFLLIVRWLPAFDEPVDGIIYAAFIALGFASYESFFYLGFLSTTEQFARGITSPLIHAMFASLWGYPIGRAILARRPLTPAIAKGMAAAIFVHGVYNFLVFGLPLWSRLLAAALILAVWAWRMHLIERVLPREPVIID